MKLAEWYVYSLDDKGRLKKVKAFNSEILSSIYFHSISGTKIRTQKGSHIFGRSIIQK